MRNTELFDDYLNGKLNAEDKDIFEGRLRTDAVFANAYNEHKELLEVINLHANRNTLKNKLKNIHQKEFGNSAKIISIDKKEKVKHLGRTALVAACTAFVVVFGAIVYVNQGVQQNAYQMEDMKHEMKAIQTGVIVGIEEGSKSNRAYAPANVEGSAFALNNNGYIVTSFHVVNGSDSVFVQNSSIERTVAKVILTNPALDLAVLRIDNKELTKNWQVPFSFSSKSSDVGEKVFTMGYPRKDMVYGEGSLSSLSGYSNDTSMYQVSIPVNPGNSGGPLLDEQGNIIGVIRGKVTDAEATGFAVKAREIIRSINTLAADSIQTTNKKASLKGVKRTEQIKRMSPYVFNVLVYKKD